MSIPASVLAVNAAPADLGAWLDGMFLPPRFGWPLNVGVVRSGGRTILIDAGLGAEFRTSQGRAVDPATGGAGIGLESLTDVVLTHMHMDHIGRAARRRGEGSAASGPADPCGDRRGRVLGGGADLSRAYMPPEVPDALSSVAKRFLDEYHSRLQPFREGIRVAPGVLVRRTGGHTPGHSVVRLESGGDRLDVRRRLRVPAGFDCPHCTTASTPSPRRRSGSGSVSCGSWRRPASRWCPLTCRSRPPAGWR